MSPTQLWPGFWSCFCLIVAMAPLGLFPRLRPPCCSDVRSSVDCRIVWDRVGPRRSLFAGYACLAVGLIAILAGHNSVLALPAASLVGLGYAFRWPALATVVVGQVPVAERAAALGALNAFYDLFVAASSAIAGAAAGQWGLTAPFWMALACVGSAAALVVISGIGRGFQALPEQTTDELAQLSIGADPVA